MVIDFHFHLTKPEHGHPWVREWIRSNFSSELEALVQQILTPAGLRQHLQANEIDWAVGLADISPITTGWTGNEFVGELCTAANKLPDPLAGPRGRLVPFASLNPFIVNDLASELTRLVDAYGFGGLKIYPTYHHHYPNDTRMVPLYAKAQELGLPVLTHTGSSSFKGARIKYGDPLLWDDVAIDFPELTILLAHAGRPFWYEQAFWMARRHANVYLEISGLPARKLLEYFPRLEEIAEKVIYGSDWPGNFDLKRNVDAIRSLPITDRAKQAILYDNAARLIRLA